MVLWAHNTGITHPARSTPWQSTGVIGGDRRKCWLLVLPVLQGLAQLCPIGLVPFALLLPFNVSLSQPKFITEGGNPAPPFPDVLRVLRGKRNWTPLFNFEWSPQTHGSLCCQRRAGVCRIPDIKSCVLETCKKSTLPKYKRHSNPAII